MRRAKNLENYARRSAPSWLVADAAVVCSSFAASSSCHLTSALRRGGQAEAEVGAEAAEEAAVWEAAADADAEAWVAAGQEEE